MANKWTNKEISILKKTIKKPIKNIRKLLPNRTESSIKHKRSSLKMNLNKKDKHNQNYNDLKKFIQTKYKSLKQELRHSEKRMLKFSAFITIISIFAGFVFGFIFLLGSVKSSIEISEKSFVDTLKLTEESLNKTFLMTTPVILQVNSTVDENEGRWYINVTNTHPTKETGKVYLYKLELNPDKPSMALDRSLKPGDSEVFSLTIKSKKENITFSQNIEPRGFSWTPPSSEAYYVNEHVSISVRITCDACSSQGVLLRVPDFGSILMEFVMTNKGIQSINMNTYEWLDYKLEDISINNE